MVGFVYMEMIVDMCHFIMNVCECVCVHGHTRVWKCV